MPLVPVTSTHRVIYMYMYTEKKTYWPWLQCITGMYFAEKKCMKILHVYSRGIIQ